MTSLPLATNSIVSNVALGLSADEANLAHSVRELTSGLQVSRPADGPSTYVAASRLQASASGLDTASDSLQTTAHAVNYATGAITSLIGITQAIRTLAVQAASSTETASELTAIQNEITTLLTEFDGISENTTFHGIPLLAGTASNTSPSIAAVASNEYDTGSATGLTTSITASFGYAPTIGDVLVAGVAHGDGYGSGGGAAVLSVPPGWTLVTNFDNGNNTGFSVYTHVVSSAESGTYTWGFTNTKPGNTSSVIVTEIAGANNVSPVATYSEIFDGNISTASPLQTSPIVAPTAGALPIAFFAPNEDNGGTATIAGWTQVAYPFQRYSDLEAQTTALTTAGETLQAGFQPNVALGTNGEATIILLTPGSTATPTTFSAPTGTSGANNLAVTPLALSSALLALTNIDVTQNATAAITTADSAIQTLGQQQAVLGAYADALQSSVSQTQLIAQADTNAAVALTATDVPQASTAYVKAALLKAVGTALLAQSNVGQQTLLDLLRPIPATGAANTAG